MVQLFDKLQSESAKERQSRKMHQLRQLVEFAGQNTAYYAERLAETDISSLETYADLQKLPVLSKAKLAEQQAKLPPLGGLLSEKAMQGSDSKPSRLFLSPGNITEIYTDAGPRTSIARCLYMAGFRRDDIVQNCFSYHLTPAAYMFESGALSMGCHVIPAGVGQTDQQAQALQQFGSTAYVGTPDFLMKILEKADQLNLSAKSLNKAMVTAGPLFPQMRQAYQQRGVEVRQCYATAELDVIAYEVDIDNGLYVNEEVIVEIVRPGTGQQVAAGEVGEVVVTKLSDEYPLIRMATGDLSVFLPEDAADDTGITARKIKGWMGRADQSTKVKGLFIRPEQVAQICQRLGLHKARAVVSSSAQYDDLLTFYCETDSGEKTKDAGFQQKVAEAVRDITKLKADVVLQQKDSLPNDGIVIEDKREIDKM